ncbi:hypothetical protein EON65_22265 [archaeon]|nr:MAG: hypothetical protein EON65_22265 [archaeon]
MIRYILVDWLFCKDTCRLDVACSNAFVRQTFLRELNGIIWNCAQVLSSGDTQIISCIKKGSKAYRAEVFDLSSLLEWLYSRGVTMHDMRLEVTLLALLERPFTNNHQYPFVSHIIISSHTLKGSVSKTRTPVFHSVQEAANANMLELTRTIRALPELTHLDIRSGSCLRLFQCLNRCLDSLPLLTSLHFGYLSVANKYFFQTHGHKVTVIEEPTAEVFELMCAYCPDLTLLPSNIGDLFDFTQHPLDFIFSHFPRLQKYHTGYFHGHGQMGSDSDVHILQLPYRLMSLRYVDLYCQHFVTFATISGLLDQCEHVQEINTQWFSWKKISPSSSFMEILSDMDESVGAQFTRFAQLIPPIRLLHCKCFVKAVLRLLPRLLDRQICNVEELELSWIRSSVVSLLLPILPSFQSLRSMRFIDSSVVMPSPDWLAIADVLAILSPHLQSLSFRCLGFVSNEVVEYFVQRLPCLAELELIGLSSVTDALLMCLLSPPRVWDRLVIKNCNIDKRKWASAIAAGLQVKMIVSDYSLHHLGGKVSQELRVGHGHVIIRAEALM